MTRLSTSSAAILYGFISGILLFLLSELQAGGRTAVACGGLYAAGPPV
jgi:hypothetical protein